VDDLYRRWTRDKTVDSNSDGKLSRQELQTVIVNRVRQVEELNMTEKEWEYILTILDQNGNGFIGFKEFNRLVKDNRGSFKPQNYKADAAVMKFLDAVTAHADSHAIKISDLYDAWAEELGEGHDLYLKGFREMAGKLATVKGAISVLVADAIKEGDKRRQEKARIEAAEYGKEKRSKIKDEGNEGAEDEDQDALNEDGESFEVKKEEAEDPEEVESSLWEAIYVLIQRSSGSTDGSISSKGLILAIQQYGSKKDRTSVLTTIMEAVVASLGEKTMLKTLFQNWVAMKTRDGRTSSSSGGALDFKEFMHAVKELTKMKELDEQPTIEDYKAAFNMIDIDRLHEIKFKQFKSAFHVIFPPKTPALDNIMQAVQTEVINASKSIKTLFQEWVKSKAPDCTSSRGFIDFKEFCASVKELQSLADKKQEASLEVLRSAFNMIDTSRKFEIQYEDFQIAYDKVFSSVHQERLNRGGAASDPTYRADLHKKNQKATKTVSETGEDENLSKSEQARRDKALKNPKKNQVTMPTLRSKKKEKDEAEETSNSKFKSEKSVMRKVAKQEKKIEEGIDLKSLMELERYKEDAEADDAASDDENVEEMRKKKNVAVSMVKRADLLLSLYADVPDAIAQVIEKISTLSKVDSDTLKTIKPLSEVSQGSTLAIRLASLAVLGKFDGSEVAKQYRHKYGIAKGDRMWGASTFTDHIESEGGLKSKLLGGVHSACMSLILESQRGVPEEPTGDARAWWQVNDMVAESLEDHRSLDPLAIDVLFETISDLVPEKMTLFSATEIMGVVSEAEDDEINKMSELIMESYKKSGISFVPVHHPDSEAWTLVCVKKRTMEDDESDMVFYHYDAMGGDNEASREKTAEKTMKLLTNKIRSWNGFTKYDKKQKTVATNAQSGIYVWLYAVSLASRENVADDPYYDSAVTPEFLSNKVRDPLRWTFLQIDPS